jgi:hypothetical protein
MVARLLSPSEWPRLVGTELEGVSATTLPGARVLAVEHDATLVGCWAAVPVLHAEGLWIAPAHRGRGGVLRALLRGMGTITTAAGARAAVVGVVDPAVAAMVTRYGGSMLAGTHYLLPMGEERT